MGKKVKINESFAKTIEDVNPEWFYSVTEDLGEYVIIKTDSGKEETISKVHLKEWSHDSRTILKG